MKEIVIDGVTYVPRRDQQAMEVDGLSYCIVRCKNAGVHAGFVKSREKGVLTLLNSRRLWRWWSKFTLSGLSQDGVLPGKEEECRFACVLPEIQLTSEDVCEVIPCTEKAYQSISSIKDHEHE